MLKSRAFSWALPLSTALLWATTAPLYASALVYQPNNGAIFSDANPNGNAAMLATAVRPKQKTEPISPLGGQDLYSILQQSTASQISAQINNELFNCGNPNCKPSGSVMIGNQQLLNYTRTPDGTLFIDLGGTKITLGGTSR